MFHTIPMMNVSKCVWERESVGESVCEFAQQKLQFREKKEYVDGGWKWKCGASFWNDLLK